MPRPARLYAKGTMDAGSRITRMSSEVLLVPGCKLPTFPRTIAADPDSSLSSALIRLGETSLAGVLQEFVFSKLTKRPRRAASQP